MKKTLLIYLVILSIISCDNSERKFLQNLPIQFVPEKENNKNYSKSILEYSHRDETMTLTISIYENNNFAVNVSKNVKKKCNFFWGELQESEKQELLKNVQKLRSKNISGYFIEEAAFYVDQTILKSTLNTNEFYLEYTNHKFAPEFDEFRKILFENLQNIKNIQCTSNLKNSL